MNIGEHISNARTTFRSNKMRSALSSLGIIIGVLSVVVLLAFGEGAQQQIVSNIQALGTNLLTVSPGGAQQSNVRTASAGARSSSNVFTTDESDLLKTVPGVETVSPEQTSRKQIIYGNQNEQDAIYGVTPAYLKVHNSEIEYGSFISDENNQNIDKVIVLGSTVASDLFGAKNPIGESVRIGNTVLTVIGIMKEKGGQGLSSADSAVFIPLTTMQNRIAGTKYLSSIAVSVVSADEMSGTKLAIEDTLMQHFGITDTTKENFSIQNQADILSTISSVIGTLKLFLGAVAVISLIVGGIGVMNIMLVSVTERTREIGIRKAIGARDRDIIGQFLSESVVLCLIGGAVGIGLSYLIIAVTQSLVHGVITINSVLMAFGFSAFVGLAFGIFPAYKAARLKPIDALRYE